MNTGFSHRTKGRVARDIHRLCGFLLTNFFLLLLLRRFHRFVPGKPVIVLISHIMNSVSNHPPRASAPPIDMRKLESKCGSPYLAAKWDRKLLKSIGFGFSTSTHVASAPATV